MPKDGGYRDLIVWQRAMVLARGVQDASNVWPRTEIFGLTSQVRRAAVAVPSNIAEGKGRTGRREYLHHLSIALGSLWELETQLQLAYDYGYLSRDRLAELMSKSEEVGRLLRGLIQSLNNPRP